MKKRSYILNALLLAVFLLSACTSEQPIARVEITPTGETTNIVQSEDPSSSADNADVEEVTLESNEEPALPEPDQPDVWTQDYITEIPPILMREPYYEIFGQADGPVPYTYEEAVKLAGHSCGATAGAWIITRKALDALYPEGEIPVRGQIAVEAPGAEDEWFVGVFGEIIAYITGAAPKTGFSGAEFGEANDLFVRQNKMVYSEEPTKQLPPMREWIFTRLDTGAKVGVKFNLVLITPIPTPARQAMGKKIANGEATPEESAEYIQYWNDRVRFVFENADSMGKLFPVTIYE
jgi:hypothetical protein